MKKAILLSFLLGFICSIGIAQCDIRDMTAERTECLDVSLFDVEIDFIYENTSDSFTLRGNGVIYGIYAYSDLPILIQELEGDCEIPYEFVAIDRVENDCQDFTELGEVCCPEGGPCSLRDMIVEPYECESNGTYFVDIDFIRENTSDSFDLDSNGEDQGRFAYSDLPITAGPYEGDCEDIRSFAVFDSEDMSCATDYGLEPVCCEQSEECEIFDLEVEVGDCNADGEYSMTIAFAVNNPSDDFFDLWINGDFRGFYNLNELPLFIEGVTPRSGDYDIVRVCLNDNPDCCAEEEYLHPNCTSEEECSLRDMIVEPYECDEEGFYLVGIDFIHENTSDSFDLDSNGNDEGRFAYTDLPITAGPYEGDCENGRSFAVFDSEEMSCATDFGLESICCDQNEECEIFDLTVEVGDCAEDGTYSISINFEVNNLTDDAFDLWVNGEFQGFYSLEDRPVVVDGITPRSRTDYDIVRVCINDNPDCCAEEEYLHPNCTSEEECSLRDMIVEPYECDEEGFYLVDIDFIHENTSDSFDLDSNGNDEGRFAYADLPITVGPYEGDCENNRSFTVFDSEEMSCATDFGLEPICCDQDGECEIFDLTVEIGDCTDEETYTIFINFEFNNPTDDAFDLWVNGAFEGFYNLEDLPINVEGIAPRDNSDYDIVRVCINDDEACCAVEEYMPPECIVASNKDTPTKAPLPFDIWIHNEKIIINNPNRTPAAMRILNSSGGLVHQVNQIQEGLHSEYLNLQNGIYFVQIYSAEYSEIFKVMR